MHVQVCTLDGCCEDQRTHLLTRSLQDVYMRLCMCGLFVQRWRNEDAGVQLVYESTCCLAWGVILDRRKNRGVACVFSFFDAGGSVCGCMCDAYTHTLWWVTADRWLRATSTPSSESLIYKEEKKTSSSPIMWHRYAKRTIGWLCPSSSRYKEVQGQLQRDQGRTLCTMCTCQEIEGGTHACKASKLGPVQRWWTQDGKLGVTIQDPPPETGRRTHLLYFYLFVFYLSLVWPLRCLFYDTMNIYFYFLY